MRKVLVVEKLQKGFVIRRYGNPFEVIGVCEADYNLKGLLDDCFEELEKENKPTSDVFPPPEMTRPSHNPDDSLSDIPLKGSF